MRFDQLQRLAAAFLESDTTNRYDANESMLFARELETIRSEPYQVEYAENVGRGVIPVDTTASNADEIYTYRQYDIVGEANELSTYGADDFPSVEIVGAEFSYKFVGVGDSYQYTLQEARAAAKLGRPLDAFKARAAREALERKLDKMVFSGSVNSATNGITGMFNAPGVVAGTLATAGPWSGKTAQQIVDDILAVRSQIRVSTFGKYHSNVLLLPLSRYEALTTKRTGVENTRSALQEIQAAMPDLRIVASPRLETINGGQPRGMLYPYNADVMKWMLSQDVETFPPEKEGLKLVTMLHARAGAVICRLPTACRYLDLI